MTSSLVGSEMCIRDRVRFRRPIDNMLESSKLSSMVDNTEGKNAGTRIISCLLYTSDAADDM
eukprot:8968982-Prorocentrum_lima.AAC.1